MAKGTTVRMWRRSVVVLVLLVLFCFSVLIARLVKLQLVDGEDLQRRAISQQLADTTISAQRGTIYDCNMKPLAQSATVWTVVLEPAHINTDEEKEVIASGLSEILEVDKDEIKKKLNNRKSYYSIVKKKVESDIKDKIIAFKTEHKITNGIRLIEDHKRYYRNGKFAAPVLGYTGSEGQGLAGLEAYYDSYLKGKPGRTITLRNAIGTNMPFDYEQRVEAQNGYSIKLTIDEGIQHILETRLEKSIVDNKVQNRATAIMMDVNTGAILAMAIKPDYDPNKPFEIADKEIREKIESLPKEERKKATLMALQEQSRLKSICDLYYPGSVFKMCTASMALEKGVVTEDTQFSCSGSVVPFPGASRVHCHKRTGHGSQTFLKALCNSCNPAFIAVGQRIGAKDFYKYYESFGFTQKTGIDLPGEATGMFFSKDGSMAPMDLVVASFGQNFSITPIQMVTAIAAIANGGKLVQPHLVSKIIDENGNIIKSIDTKVKRQVISEKTSKRVCAMLQTNVAVGSGRNGYVAGYSMAGKTGTTQDIGIKNNNVKSYVNKCLNIEESYTGMNYKASYGGFGPGYDPKVALLVICDTPKGPSYYGSFVAAPVFASTMESALPYLGLERKYTEEEIAKLDTTAPNVVNKSVSVAKSEVVSSGLTPIVIGSGEKVVSQIPAAYKQIPQNGTIVLYTDSKGSSSSVLVPNFVGKTMTDVNRLASQYNLNISIKGSALSGGTLASSSQSISEGTKVPRGTVITVEFIQKDSVQ